MKRFILIFSLLFFASFTFAQKFAELSSNYKKFNLNPYKVEKWEDGTRTDGAKGTYEWWYFDFKLNDGTTLVIDFLTKPITNINTQSQPLFFVDITKPDGTKIRKQWNINLVNYYAATDSCYVQMGKSYVKGNLKTYFIHIDQNDFKADLTLKNTAQSWRPKTGYLVFDYTKYFAWLVAVPEGNVSGKITFNGKTYNVSGSGYHDHNWGNYPMDKLIHHWYWSRTKFQNYAVIAADVISEKQYGYKNFPIFVVFHNGKVVTSKYSKTVFYQNDPQLIGDKPVSKKILFWYSDNNYQYILKLNEKQIISQIKLIQTYVKNKALALSLEKAGYNATYYRMTGNAQLWIIQNKNINNILQTDKAIWELMYFGKPF